MMIDGSTLSDLYKYCEMMSDLDDPVLYDLYRETHLKTLAPRMASGPIQGRFLSLLSVLKRPVEVLEIGTFTGYATLCLAKGLAANGRITTIEINPELDYISDKYFKLAGVREKIHSIKGDALTIIPCLDGPFDLVFIDAKKNDYSAYYKMVIDKVAKGGLIIADNVLWDGKVITGETDHRTENMHHFNMEVKSDCRVKSLLLPIRDGLMILEKV